MRSAPRPFIGYAHEDRPAAIQLYGDLRAMGAQPWLDAADLLPGQDWELAIREALRSATHFVALISRRSVNKRGYVQRELRQALELYEEFPPGAIFLIPARLEPVEPRYEQLRKVQWADLFEDRTTALEKIGKSLGIAASKAFRVEGAGQVRAAARVTRANGIEAASRWMSVSVNDLLPSYAELARALADAHIEPTYLFSTRGVQGPPPVYNVVVAHSKVGITVLRYVCATVARSGKWFVQIWDEGISENSISIGAYGYGGSPAVSIDRALLSKLRSRPFTMSKLRNLIETQGEVLLADYPING